MFSQVTIEDPTTGKAVEFPCHRWFATSEDDGQITRELTREDEDEAEKNADKGRVREKQQINSILQRHLL